MKATYYNRYGDNIVFNKIDDNTVEMSGFEYSRTGYNEDGTAIQFVDPAGGPFIAVGMNINRYFNVKSDMIIKSIIWDKKTILTI
jgi:hypothetical protein